jgi:hypothetical protein
MARVMSASVPNVVSTSTRTAGSLSRRVAMAAGPSSSGICRSISTTSGRNARASSTAWVPVAASPTSCMSGWVASIARSPSRTTGWSSAISSRIGSFTAAPFQCW